MIRVDIFRKDGNIVKVVMDGHAEYSDGDDIVCASASSVAYAMLNGIEKLVGVKFGYETGDGYLYFVLPDDMNKSDREKTALITETFCLFVNDLADKYSDNVKVTELEV